jgi:hypothetical protein
MSYELAVNNSKLITQHLKLIGLLAVYLALATFYSAAIPLGEGPDEPGHADYAFFLARTRRLPVQRLDPRQADVPGEGHQPPLAYVLAAPLGLSLPREERKTDTIGNPRFVWNGGAETNAISHGSREYPPWQANVLAWHLMRLVSVVCGAATIAFTYLAARSLAERLEISDLGSTATQSPISNLQSLIPLLAAGLVAFNPQFLFVAALVTNDALLAALSAALLWLIIRNGGRKRWTDQVEQRSELLKFSIALGTVLGLALLTKQSAAIFVPVAVLTVMAGVADKGGSTAFAETTAQKASRIWRALSRHPFRIFCGLLVIAAAALVAGWWYMRNLRLYGDLFGLAAFRGEFVTQPFQIGSPAAWGAALGQLHASFWARFGWMNVLPPGWVFWPIGAIEIAAVGGLLRTALRSRRTDRRPVVARRSSVVGHWALLALPALALAWMVSFAVTAGLVAWQGRLLFPALPAIAILLARGLAAWKNKEQRTKNSLSDRLILFFVLCPLFLLAAWMPENVIRLAYPPQTLPEPVALAQAGNSVVFRFRRRGERSITLRGWRLAAPARPGQVLDLRLTWYASARQVRDWVVFVELADDQGRVVAEDHGEPRDGMFPTTQWNLGDWIEDRHQLQLPADTTDGTYTLRIWLQDSRNQQRAEVRIDESKPLGNVLDLGSIIVGG